MDDTPPAWWQPVMAEVREIVGPQHPVFFDFIRDLVARQVKADLIPTGLTQKQARKAVMAFVLILLEEVVKPHMQGNHPDIGRFAERCVEEMEAVWSQTQ